jgi:hypothetical protein
MQYGMQASQNPIESVNICQEVNDVHVGLGLGLVLLTVERDPIFLFLFLFLQ